MEARSVRRRRAPLDFDSAIDELIARWGGEMVSVATLDRASGRITADLSGTLDGRQLLDDDNPAAGVVLEVSAAGRSVGAIIRRREDFGRRRWPRRVGSSVTRTRSFCSSAAVE